MAEAASPTQARRSPERIPQITPPATPVRAVPRPPAAARKRPWLRPVLFMLLPLALAAGAYSFVTGGQVLSTDNAYVQAQSLGVSTDVSGTVAAIDVHNDQHVEKGQVLFRLKDESFHIALAGAQAQLGTVRNQVLTLQASYAQSLVQVDQAKAELPYYEVVFRRQQDLVASVVASKALYDQALHDLITAHERVSVAQSQAGAMLAQLGNSANQPVEQNPFYLQAKSAVDNAQRELDDTVVRAPFSGIVTNVDALQAGAYLKASEPGFSLISDTNMWVEANPKETELTYVKIGQRVKIMVDMYPDTDWDGVVESISPASGSSFSLLPAQNTTGNWVKVVQRIPMRVRLALTPDKPQLRVGMSAIVDVDTHHPRGMPASLQRLIDHYFPHHV